MTADYQYHDRDRDRVRLLPPLGRAFSKAPIPNAFGLGARYANPWPPKEGATLPAPNAGNGFTWCVTISLPERVDL